MNMEELYGEIMEDIKTFFEGRRVNNYEEFLNPPINNPYNIIAQNIGIALGPFSLNRLEADL